MFFFTEAFIDHCIMSRCFFLTETFIDQTSTELHEESVTTRIGASFSTNSWTQGGVLKRITTH
jgi:hypothetical protein